MYNHSMIRYKNSLLVFLLITLSFTWMGSSYFTWFYRLLSVVKEHNSVDIITDVIGYVFQASGILTGGILYRKLRNSFIRRNAFLLAAAFALLFLVLAVMSRSFMPILVFGLLMNIFFGTIFYLYLLRLSTAVPDNRRGTVFGLSYACSSIFTWLLSLPGGGTFLSNPAVLIIYTAIAAGSAAVDIVIRYLPADMARVKNTYVFPRPLLLLTGITVFLLSLTKNMGGSFPIADLPQLGNVIEFSRLFYAAGLIIAGFISDYSRKTGAICCAVALFSPFVQLFFRYTTGASIGLWFMNYLLFGLFSVYRIVIYTDIARKSPSLVYLAGFGMFFGRLGDAIGTYTGIILRDDLTSLMICTSIMFIVTTSLFFAFYQRMYFAKPATSKSIQTLIDEFASAYMLSSREVAVFTLLLDRKTNCEIAEALVISESTVKFHVKNILKKTSCSNRNDLIAFFNKQDL